MDSYKYPSRPPGVSTMGVVLHSFIGVRTISGYPISTSCISLVHWGFLKGLQYILASPT